MENEKKLATEDAISMAVIEVLRDLLLKSNTTSDITVREMQLMMVAIIHSQKKLMRIRAAAEGRK